MADKQSQGAAAKESPLVILCVDDEKPALFLRSAVFTSAGYKVLTAGSSVEALQVFAENHVDLVITDHLLVGATGTALAKEIKQLRPQIPVVILSGVVDEPEGMSAANLFLSKNAGPTEMLAQVARLLKL
jgi:two-component system, OmpR family, response regulator CpxR